MEDWEGGVTVVDGVTSRGNESTDHTSRTLVSGSFRMCRCPITIHVSLFHLSIGISGGIAISVIRHCSVDGVGVVKSRVGSWVGVV
jgi:hypothetical protein